MHSRLTASQAYTTLELKVAYHKPITRHTGLLRAEGRVLSFGRRAAFAEAKLTDVSGKLYASATSTLLESFLHQLRMSYLEAQSK